MNITKEIKGRNLNIDMLRVICSIAIVVMHVIDFYILSYNEVGEVFWTFINILESLIRFALPIFFMISGALLIKNFKEGAMTFYKKRLVKIVVPYILSSIVYSVGNQILKTGGISLETIARDIIEFEAHYHLWFFRPLIVMYILVPVIRKIILYIETNNKRYIINWYLAIWTVLGIIIPTIVNIYNSTGIIYGIESINYMGYFILGYAISNYYKDLLKNKEKLLAFTYVIAVIATIIANNFYLNREIGVFNNYFIHPMTFNIYIQAVSIFIYFNLKTIRLSEKVMTVVQVVGVSSIYIYILHPLFILIVRDVFNIDFFTGNLYFKSILVTLMVCILTVIASIISAKIFNFFTKKLI